MTTMTVNIPDYNDALLYYLRFKWRGIQRKYRGQGTYSAGLMRAAARMAIREINTELLNRDALREPLEAAAKSI